jgi:hypothetical protein
MGGKPRVAKTLNVVAGMAAVVTGDKVQKAMDGSEWAQVQSPARSTLYAGQKAAREALEAKGHDVCAKTLAAYIVFSKEEMDSVLWVAVDGSYTTCRNYRGCLRRCGRPDLRVVGCEIQKTCLRHPKRAQGALLSRVRP